MTAPHVVGTFTSASRVMRGLVPSAAGLLSVAAGALTRVSRPPAPAALVARRPRPAVPALVARRPRPAVPALVAR
ncbi:MAG TPA: hypothetical protein VF933_27870, partial [Streptosporangiaceae bacterium]